MVTRRGFLLGLLAASSVAAIGAIVTEAEATPGMVNAAGCHGHPRHCHHGGFRVNRAGRRYIPGNFFGGRKKRRRRRGRRRRR